MPISNVEDFLLVVDDEDGIRLSLCDFLELEGFEVCDAPDGVDALKILKTRSPKLIISDLMMPEVGGLELLEEMEKRKLDIPVIIMTAFGTVEYAIKAMKNGAADFVTKPIDQDYLLKVINRVIKSSQMEQKLKNHQMQLEDDLKLASKIQQAILPKMIDTPQLSMNYRFEPLIEIGGDHLNVHKYDEDHIAVAIYDVTGHGVAAALVANMIHNQLTIRLKEERPPYNVVEHLDRFMNNTIGDTHTFATLVIVDINLHTKTLTVCNAGHPELLIWKHAENTLKSISSHLPPVGLTPNMVADNSATKIPISSGDRIIMYTDGFTETEDRNGQMLGQKGFKELVEKNIRFRTSDFIDEMFKTVNELQVDEAEDDRTLAVVEIK